MFGTSHSNGGEGLVIGGGAQQKAPHYHQQHHHTLSVRINQVLQHENRAPAVPERGFRRWN
jgi:hypothetical protein